jgi:hypothetical protein
MSSKAKAPAAAAPEAKKAPVPETVLKAKKTLAQIQADRAAAKAAAKKVRPHFPRRLRPAF